MTKSVNKVILLGDIEGIPENKVMGSGIPVTNVVLVTSVEYQNKDKENKKVIQFHKVSFFGKLTEISYHLKSGMKLYVEGSLKTRVWDDSDGKKNYSTEIIAKELHILSPGNHEKEQGDDFYSH